MASEPLYGKGVLAGRFCGGSVHLVSIFVVVLVEEICRPVALGYVREIIVLRGIPGERREYHHRWLRRAKEGDIGEDKPFPFSSSFFLSVSSPGEEQPSLYPL